MTTLFKIEAKEEIKEALKTSLNNKNSAVLLFNYSIAVVNIKSSNKKPYRFEIYTADGQELAKGRAADLDSCIECVERAYDEICDVINNIKSQKAERAEAENSDKITLVLTKEEAMEVSFAIENYLEEDFFSVLVPNYVTTEISTNGSNVKKTTFRDGWRIGNANGGKMSDAEASELYYSAIRSRTLLNRIFDRLPDIEELKTDKLGMDD